MDSELTRFHEAQFNSMDELIQAYYPTNGFPILNPDFVIQPRFRQKLPGPTNAHGYRADEFDQRRDLNIAYLGCCWTHGFGLEREHVFADVLTEMLTKTTGKSVSNWNLALTGGGVDYILRMLPYACSELRPDVISLTFNFQHSREVMTRDGRRHSYQPGQIYRLAAGRLQVPDDLKEMISAIGASRNPYEDMSHFLRHYRAIEMILNLSGIPWVFSWIGASQHAPVMEKLLEAGVLSRANYLGQAFNKIDKVSDQDTHVGPLSHKKYAEALHAWFLANIC